MERLPRGRHGLPREFVARNQRERLIAGLAEALYERGYEKTTVAAIGKCAGVSKSDFYKHFESKDECFLAAFDVSVERIRERVAVACAGRDEWATGVRDALAALLETLVDEPALARLALVEGLRSGRGVYDRYQEALLGFVSLLGEGAPPAPGGAAMPEATDEAVVGGIANLLARRILTDQQDLEPLLGDLTEFALTPYLGAIEARRVATEEQS